MVAWTKERLDKLSREERASLYQNALNTGGTAGEELAKLIETSGLPYINPTCPSDNSPTTRTIDDMIATEEVRQAIFQAAEQGLPALAGFDPLLQKVLGSDYGKHNMTTATAGDRVAQLMRSRGYREAGIRPLPKGCVARSAMLWVK